MVFTKKKAVISILLFLFIGFLFLPPISVRLKTLATVINLLIPSGDWRPLQIFTKAPNRELEIIQSASGQTLDVHIYTPSRKADAAMIIYTPFIGGGAEDARLTNLAQTFARSGFIVATPFRKEGLLIVSTKDIDDIISTVLFLKNESGLDIQNIGIFGISYGNGPAIAAAADPRIRELVKFIVSFGGFYDLDNALNFIRTGEYSYQDIAGKLEPHSYAKEILSNTITSYNMNEGKFLKSAALKDLKEKLSPSRMIEKITAEFFIVHSTNDIYIPYTESMQLYDALRSSGKFALFSLTTAFEHGVYKPLTFKNFHQHYWPSFSNFYALLYRLLSKHL